MRVRIRHKITRRFDPAARHVTAAIRLSPRAHEGQFILRWVLDLSCESRLNALEDSFGNICHTFCVDGPATEVTVIAEGEVETQETTGIVRGTVERFPPSLYLRQTDITEPTAAIEALAGEVKAPDDPLSRLHALMELVHSRVKECTPPTNRDPLKADDVLKEGTACSAGITHLFTAVARHLKIPARHISGYLAAEGQDGEARHWAEAHVPGYGWIACDSGRNLCATENYVRLAVGLDCLGVAPLRGIGGEMEESVTAYDGRWAAKVAQAQSQGQNQ